MRRTFTFTIVAVWAVMVALLLHKQGTPPAPPGEPLPAAASGERDEWFGIYHHGTKVGHAHRVSAHLADGYRFYEDSVIALAMLGVPQKLGTSMVAETDKEFALRHVRFTLISPATVFTVTATVKDGQLSATYGPRGQSAEMHVPLSEPIFLPSTLRPRVLAGARTPGTRYTVPVFSPLTLRHEPMTITIEGAERMTGPDGPVDTVRLAEDHRGVQARAWLADDGTVVREEAALGFTLERESAERAVAASSERAPVDLTVASRIPLDGRIDDPRATARLQLRVSGAGTATIPNDPPRQRLAAELLRIVREELPVTVPLPLVAPDDARAHLAPSPLIESDDATIIATARRVVGDSTDAVVATRRLVEWVEANLEKAPSVTVPSAREVLAARRGDCNEHAVLLTALARAAGIPARVVAGAVYADDGFYYHAWTEVWLGRWVSADAVFGQLPADATHVKLVEGDAEHYAALAGMIGKLAFALEEAE